MVYFVSFLTNKHFNRNNILNAFFILLRLNGNFGLLRLQSNLLTLFIFKPRYDHHDNFDLMLCRFMLKIHSQDTEERSSTFKVVHALPPSSPQLLRKFSDLGD